MFYWPKLMLETERIDDRLARLSPARRVAFATACAQHALLRFLEVWWQEHFQPSNSGFIPIMLGIVEAIWKFIPRIGEVPDLADVDRQLELIGGPDYHETITWNEGELLNATLQALDCLREGGSARRAVLAAKNAYNAVSKWYCARANPGRAMSSAQAIEFEKRNPECQAEFRFQLGCLTFLEHGVEPIPSYTLIAAALRRGRGPSDV
jgi:hypothetical protein